MRFFLVSKQKRCVILLRVEETNGNGHTFLIQKTFLYESLKISKPTDKR